MCAENRALNCWPCVPIVDPFARRRDPLAGRNGCGMADHGHDVTMTARLGPQHAKAVLDVMIRDALDKTCKNLLGRFLGRGFHGHQSSYGLAREYHLSAGGGRRNDRSINSVYRPGETNPQMHRHLSPEC